jgi:hypothetical protein
MVTAAAQKGPWSPVNSGANLALPADELGCPLLLLGDAGQLPPIDLGAGVSCDGLRSGNPAGRAN